MLMTKKMVGVTTAVLAVFVVLVCTRGGTATTTTSIPFENGHCAGCIPSTEDSLFTITVITHADFDSLTANCFSDRTTKEWLPPRPTAENTLVYVSLDGDGCEGCLDVVDVYETDEDIVVAVTGGFRGKCDKLIMLGAWALLPRTGKRIVIRFQDVACFDQQ
jgi:hypothetical protein